MKVKKTKILVMFMSLIIVLLVTLLYGIYVWFTSSRIESSPNAKYYKYERYETPMDKTIYFSKKYYYDEADEFYKKNGNGRYMLVENNVETIKNNISIALNKLNELDNSINIEFNYDNITSNDYYDLSEGYNLSVGEDVLLYYYDIDEHILYVTHFFK